MKGYIANILMIITSGNVKINHVYGILKLDGWVASVFPLWLKLAFHLHIFSNSWALLQPCSLLLVVKFYQHTTKRSLRNTYLLMNANIHTHLQMNISEYIETKMTYVVSCVMISIWAFLYKVHFEKFSPHFSTIRCLSLHMQLM